MLQNRNAGIVVEEPESFHKTPQCSKKGEEEKDKTNYNNWMKKASKKKTEVDVEEQKSHQQTPPSTKKRFPTSEKKKAIVKTDCNRNIKQEEYSKCDKSNHKVCIMMFP